MRQNRLQQWSKTHEKPQLITATPLTLLLEQAANIADGAGNKCKLSICHLRIKQMCFCTTSYLITVCMQCELCCRRHKRLIIILPAFQHYWFCDPVPLSPHPVSVWRWSDWVIATSLTGTSRCSAHSVTQQLRPGPPPWMRSWARWESTHRQNIQSERYWYFMHVLSICPSFCCFSDAPDALLINVPSGLI